MIIESIIIGGAVVLGGATLSTMIYTVKEKQEALIQRFGKYIETTKEAGLHFKMPWNSVRKIEMNMQELKEPLDTKTKDDIFVKLPIKIHVEVEDSKKYTFNSDKPDVQVLTRVAATVKQLTSQMDFAELYQARETISERVRDNVAKEIYDLYGVRLVDVIVDEPHVDGDFQSRYNNVKASEMDRLAAKNLAEAEKISIITQAEARKEALKLDGEGIAAQRKAIFENYAEQFNKLAQQGLTQDQAHQVITLAMANDTIRDAAKHGNTILTTTNSNDILSQMSALGKTLTSKTVGKESPANDTGAAPHAPKNQQM